MLIFSCISLAPEDRQAKTLLCEMSEILLPMFSSRVCMVSCLTFESFTHFEFILVYDVSWWSIFIFLHVPVQFSQRHLKKPSTK